MFGNSSGKIKVGSFFFGVVLIIIGMALYLGYDPGEYDSKTMGTVVAVDQSYDVGDSNRIYKIRVDYNAYGRQYRGVEYSVQAPVISVGDIVTVYYKSSDPSQVATNDKDSVPKLGMLIAVLGVFDLYIVIKRTQRRRRKALVRQAEQAQSEMNSFNSYNQNNNGGIN